MELKQADLKSPYPPCHPFKGYFFLFLGLLIFSGLFTGVKGPLGSLDFVTLLGEFGLSDGSRIGFQGVGASEANYHLPFFSGSDSEYVFRRWPGSISILPSPDASLPTIAGGIFQQNYWHKFNAAVFAAREQGLCYQVKAIRSGGQVN